MKQKMGFFLFRNVKLHLAHRDYTEWHCADTAADTSGQIHLVTRAPSDSDFTVSLRAVFNGVKIVSKIFLMKRRATVAMVFLFERISWASIKERWLPLEDINSPYSSALISADRFDKFHLVWSPEFAWWGRRERGEEDILSSNSQKFPFDSPVAGCRHLLSSIPIKDVLLAHDSPFWIF